MKLKHRDKSGIKYEIDIIDRGYDENQDYNIAVSISDLNFTNKKYSDFFIIFKRAWILDNSDIENHRKYLFTTDDYSPLINYLIRDFMVGKDIHEVSKKNIIITDESEYSKRIVRGDNGLFNFSRDPVVVAKENRFAREIVLKDLYHINSSGGAQVIQQLFEICNYDTHVIRNAVDALISKGFIEIIKNQFYRLTYNGLTFVEEKLLSTFNNKIFLIAACNNDIKKLIEHVYRPAVQDGSDYELKFQEMSEPKGTIHEDIWNYIEGSKLIICDFTDRRPNCFIEYGYALAKGKHIILCVEEKEGKDKSNRLKVPFDTQPQKYSFWKKGWLENNDFENLEKYKKEIRDRISMKLDILDLESKI